MEESKTCSTINALQDVLRRLQAGHFHSQFDAMCLASVELDTSSKQRVSFATPLSAVKPIQGLQGLSSEILGILNSAVIAEQGTLAFLQQELEALHCSILLSSSEEAAETVEVGSDKTFPSLDYSDENSQNLSRGTLDSDWNSLPHASDEIARPPLLLSRADLVLQPSSSVLSARSDTHRRLQPLYNETFELLAAKTLALELVDVLLGAYVQGAAGLAASNGIAYAAERAQYIAQPCLVDLLSHRFLDATRPKAVMRALQNLASQTYLRGHDDLAKCRLALDYRDSQQTSASVHTGAFKRGAALVLLLWAVSECFNNERAGRDIWKDPTFSIFVCLGDLTLLLWLWGASISVWRRAGIDYLHLLSLQHTDLASACLGDYSSAAPEQAVFASATDLSLLFLFSFVVFNKALRGSFSHEGEPAAAHAIPSCLLLFYAARFFSPWASSRRAYLRMLWQVLAAPYYAVTFRDGYIGDLLTSLVRVSISLSFSLVYLAVEVHSWLTNDLEAVESTRMSPWWQRSYLYRFQLVPFLTLLPLWLRFMQCLRRSLESGRRWPHLFNALKYSCAIMVFSFGVLHPDLQRNGLWILALCCATCYQFCWDVAMDWGLVQVDKAGRMSMRTELSLGPPRLYFALVACNFVLRFAWAVTYVPREIHHYSPLYSYVYNNFQTVMAAAEIVRRMVWGFLRLEWEHIERTGAAPLSLSRQRALAREAAGLRRRGGARDSGWREGVDLMSMGGDLEMHRMDIGSGHERDKASAVSLFSHVYPPHLSSSRHSGEGEGQDEGEDEGEDGAMQGGSGQQQEEGESELHWLLECLPLDLAALFPFFLFQGLRESAARLPPRRFQARVLEGLCLASVVLCVMAVSALTKMHSAGYI